MTMLQPVLLMFASCDDKAATVPGTKTEDRFLVHEVKSPLADVAAKAAAVPRGESSGKLPVSVGITEL